MISSKSVDQFRIETQRFPWGSHIFRKPINKWIHQWIIMFISYSLSTISPFLNPYYLNIIPYLSISRSLGIDDDNGGYTMRYYIYIYIYIHCINIHIVLHIYIYYIYIYIWSFIASYHLIWEDNILSPSVTGQRSAVPGLASLPAVTGTQRCTPGTSDMMVMWISWEIMGKS